MRVQKDSLNIVVLGSWNPGVFRETWVAEHLLVDRKSPVKVAYPIDDPTAPRRIEFEGLVLFPGRKQIICIPINQSLDGLIDACRVVNKIVELLEHTPIIACGLNLAFEENINTDKLSAIYEFSDKTDLANEDLDLGATSISRTFNVGASVLNFTVTQYSNGDAFNINFNYHFELVDKGFTDVVSSALLKDKFALSVSLCSKLYGLKLAEEVNSD